MSRRGFTLVEMLVATIVFLVGFVAVFGLFLGGLRFRKLAEDTTRASLAASCLVDEIRSSAGGSGTASPSTSAPLAPSAYIGTGFATAGSGSGAGGGASQALTTALYNYAPVPGTWYRVLNCTDINGNTANAQTTVLHLQLFVLPFATSSPSLTFADLNHRLLNDMVPPLSTVDQVADELIRRGVGFRYQSVITRRPSWLP
jgi:prepilin-type N-terminal cleavage/methylation domain-containing protein